MGVCKTISPAWANETTPRQWIQSASLHAAAQSIQFRADMYTGVCGLGQSSIRISISGGSAAPAQALGMRFMKGYMVEMVLMLFVKWK